MKYPTVFNITTARRNKIGGPIYLHFACNGATLESLAEALSEGKLVVGTKLTVMKEYSDGADYDSPPVMRVAQAMEIAISRNEVASIAVSTVRYLAEGEEP